MTIQEHLQGACVSFAPILHAPAASAARLARNVHVSGDRVAKSVLVRTADGYILAVLPATYRVDVERLSEVLGIADVSIASESEVESIFRDCELGATPPFGRLYGMRTVVDDHLAGAEEIIIEGNTRHEGFRLRYSDYAAIERPFGAAFATAASPAGRSH